MDVSIRGKAGGGAQTTPHSKAPPTMQSRPKLAWLHVPKAGQSFLTTLALYGCSDNRTESRLISVRASETMLRLHAEGARQVAHKTSRLLGMTSSQRCPRLLQEFTTGHGGAPGQKFSLHDSPDRYGRGHGQGFFREIGDPCLPARPGFPPPETTQPPP